MDTTITSKGQITIPKEIRDSLDMGPGCKVNIVVNHDGDVVLHKLSGDFHAQEEQFDLAIGSADIKWRTDELMALLRGED